MIEHVVRPVEQDGGAEQQHVEAQRVEQRGECAVELEAPAAAAPVDDLVEGAADVGREMDRPGE